MPSNKPRLHVALYERGIPDPCGDPSYHWALIVGPKKETEKTTPAGKRYHAINTKLPNDTAPWRYEVVNLRRPVTSLLLVRITIAKVVDQVRLERTLQDIPVAQRPGFTCRTWVSAAIAALAKDGGLGTSTTMNWDTIQRRGFEYVAEKKAAGRWKNAGKWKIGMPSTYSMIEGKEMVP